MKTYVIAFLLATAACAALTPFARRLAFRLGAVSIPGGRNVNDRSVPRLGGIAICIAFFVPLTALLFVESEVADLFREQPRRLIGLAVGGIAMCALGVLDDTRRVRALYKLVVQVGVALTAFAFDFKIEAVRLPLVGDLSMGVFSLPITVLWIVGIVNAINLIDGLDGLAAGVVFFAAVTNFVVAILSGSVLVALLMAVLLGAVVGFLFYNFNPARIFMGDSGSYFLGYLLATISLLGSMQRASTAVSLLVPILALGVPIFDTLFSMVRRLLERRPVFSPDRGHLHHRLLDMGITHRRAVLILYAVSLGFTVAAISVSLGRSWQVGLALLFACVMLVGIVRFAGYFEYLHGVTRQVARLRSADTERLRRAIPDFAISARAARDEEDVFTLLAEFVSVSGIFAAELALHDDGAAVSRRIESNRDPKPAASELVSAKYPVGPDASARTVLKFVWEADGGFVSPQAEVLLQLVVDVVCHALSRTGSEAAPAQPRLNPGTSRIATDSSIDIAPSAP